MFDNDPRPSPQLVKKFYFLDYLYILLLSCRVYEDKNKIFSLFKELKDKERLGESKYKKLTIDPSDLTLKQEQRYKYTFEQVIFEAVAYELIRDNKGSLSLTESGKNCVISGEKDRRVFYEMILKQMENKYFAFYHLVKLCYAQNETKNGLLIFPIYSPRKLGMEKIKMKTNGDWIKYSNLLKRRIEIDIEKFLDKKIDLTSENQILLNNLYQDDVISKDVNELFHSTNYNSIINRFRKHWLNFFLKNIYKYEFSFEVFNIWVERGKQLGIIHSTEFYPDFDGRLVYPTSLIIDKNNSPDLVPAYFYKNKEKLYIHKPQWNKNQEIFIDTLYKEYLKLKRTRGTHFLRLSDLRERVCYKSRIPSFIFDEFLEKIYNLNLKGDIRIKISLEADRLPHETNAMYLKREPILINGQYKNIIAIDYNK